MKKRFKTRARVFDIKPPCAAGPAAKKTAGRQTARENTLKEVREKTRVKRRA